METTKRTRRSDDQLLADTITALYGKIQNKLTNIQDEKAVVEQIFESLRPLRQLEDQYRNASDSSRGYDGK